MSAPKPTVERLAWLQSLQNGDWVLVHTPHERYAVQIYDGASGFRSPKTPLRLSYAWGPLYPKTGARAGRHENGTWIGPAEEADIARAKRSAKMYEVVRRSHRMFLDGGRLSPDAALMTDDEIAFFELTLDRIGCPR